MPADTADFDFLAFCRPGMVLTTRDRRAARILTVMPERGEISGEVQMMGACTWRADGRYRDAPAGAAGPWDLMPPKQSHMPDRPQPRDFLAAAHLDPSNPGCCD